jgi:hypothetical protein
MIKDIYLVILVLLLNFTVKSIPKQAFFTSFLVLILVFSAPIPLVQASSKSPYDSGYDHGCDDAGISDPSDRYINQPEKGPSFHTSEFMNGYYSGVNSCGGNSGGSYYEQPQQAQGKDSLGEDLGQLVECAGTVSPLASAGTVGTVIGGIGCALYAGEVDK